MSRAVEGSASNPSSAADAFPRVIGHLRAPDTGPTLICVGSVHGNEPAGFRALNRVVRDLETAQPRMEGEFVALSGNRSALATGRRFVDEDLNRIWLPKVVAAVAGGDGKIPPVTEHTELRELLELIERVVHGARGPVYMVDLHTTSGDSPPFATIGDTLSNRAFAMRTGVPIILGLEEHLDGTLLGYADRKGHVTLGFEGGRHDDPQAVDYLEACIWIALATSGVLRVPSAVPQVADARQRLRVVSRGLPRVLEVRYRHSVNGTNRFVMAPGYSSFQTIEAGEVLARDESGPVSAPERGRLLMPLYQRQGDDGFFVMREFRPFWLTLSAWLRRLRADAVVHWLPGVRRDPVRSDTVVVNRRTARWYALEIFHLLGYRRLRLEGDTLVVSRRREPN